MLTGTSQRGRGLATAVAGTAGLCEGAAMSVLWDMRRSASRI